MNKHHEKNVVDEFLSLSGKLKSCRSLKLLGEEKEWREYAQLLESIDEYKKMISVTPYTKEVPRILKEDVESYKQKSQSINSNEELLQKMTDRIIDILKSYNSKSEDLDGGIGVDDVGRDAGLMVPLGGGSEVPMVSSPRMDDPAISKAISQESFDKLKDAVEVLKSVGAESESIVIDNFLSSVEVV